MNLHNELLTKELYVLEAEINNKISVYKYITVISLMVSLVGCIMYNRENELSKAKSSQLHQREARIIEKNQQIQLLEELNINLSKNK